MTNFIFTFGKYKGKRLKDLTTTQDANYLNWLLQSDANKQLNEAQRKSILTHLTGKP